MLRIVCTCTSPNPRALPALNPWPRIPHRQELGGAFHHRHLPIAVHQLQDLGLLFAQAGLMQLAPCHGIQLVHPAPSQGRSVTACADWSPPGLVRPLACLHGPFKNPSWALGCTTATRHRDMQSPYQRN